MYAISSEQAMELSLKFRLLRLQFIEEAKQEQQKEQQRKERKLAELREQDSLRNLMETGNYDHKKVGTKYIYPHYHRRRRDE